MRTVFLADAGPWKTRGLTLRGSAEPILPAVPPTKAAFVRCIGAAAADKTLALCAVFVAHAVRLRLGGAAINRARFLAAGFAEPSGVDFVGAAPHRAHL